MLLAGGEWTVSSSPESRNLVFIWPRPLHQPHVLQCNHLSRLFCKRLKRKNRKIKDYTSQWVVCEENNINLFLALMIKDIQWGSQKVKWTSPTPWVIPKTQSGMTLNQDHEPRQPRPRCMLLSWVWWGLINHNARQIHQTPVDGARLCSHSFL